MGRGGGLVCNNYKSHPIPNTKRKRKETNQHAQKNKQMHEKHIEQLSLPQAR